MSDSDETETVSIPVPTVKPTKVRMPRTEAQKAATQKGLEALARRRAEMLEAKSKSDAPAEKPKRAVIKPDPEYFTPEMVEKAKSIEPVPAPKPVKRKAVEPAPKAPKTVEPEPKTVEPAPKAPKAHKSRKSRMIVVEDSSSEESEPIYIKRPKHRPAPQPLSGSDLLDQIFFSRR